MTLKQEQSKEKSAWFAKAPEAKPWTRRQRLWQFLLSIAAVLILYAVFTYNINRPISIEEVLPPIASPPVLGDITMTMGSGGKALPYSFADKTLVYFFQGDCCADDLRQLILTHQQLNSEKLGLSIVATDKNVKRAIDYLGNVKLANVNLFFQPKATILVQPEIYPTTWLMDRSGRLLAIRNGKVNWHHPNIKQALQELVATDG